MYNLDGNFVGAVGEGIL